jgi:glycosyltransferase involved in cell wall biosynthesis
VTPPVVIIVPVLNRPHRVIPTMQSVAAATPEPHRLLFVASRSDSPEVRALAAAGAHYLLVAGAGTYPAKVNAAYQATTEPLLFLAADDLEFHPGWLSTALELLEPGVEVIGTNDLGNPRVLEGLHSTHTLVTRAYCDDPGATADQAGTVLHQGYRHLFVDDELVGVAQARGVYAHAADAVVEHMHPYFDKAETDSTYARGHRNVVADQALYDRRVTLWR